MTSKESIEILDKVCCLVDEMTDAELFEYMMENSNSFRTEISKINFDMKCTTCSTFFKTNSFSVTSYSSPNDICTSSTFIKDDVFMRIEEMEDFEWQMMTEAA